MLTQKEIKIITTLVKIYGNLHSPHTHTHTHTYTHKKDSIPPHQKDRYLFPYRIIGNKLMNQ